MGKKINPHEYIEKELINKYDEKFKVINYQFQKEKHHYFEIEFLETKNVRLITLAQIKAGTCRDIEEQKKLKRMKVELDLRRRNRLVTQPKKHCVIPNNLREKNVLAIDLATRTTGIAYSKKGSIVRWKTIQSDLEDFRDRAWVIVSELVEILEKGKTDVVILEDVYLGLNSDVLSKLSEVRGMLTFHIKRLGIELLLVPANVWKKRIEGVPLLRKDQKEFMMQKFFKYTGVEADSDDSADAYMMLKACL